jgi:hypothetical protein
MNWRLTFLACTAAAALMYAGGDNTPKIGYTKSFPGSVPAYVSIELSRDGGAIYKEAPDDASPIKFQVSKDETDQIFALADKLDRFKRPLESPLKVAFMGMKTFRYENGAEKSETKFNYSQDEDARLIADWFERLSETQQYLFNLERSVRFDKLGVNSSLLQLEIALERKRIVGRERFLPLLDRVAKNDSYMHMARERAASLADLFRNNIQPKPE